jgi:hypothetical protein
MAVCCEGAVKDELARRTGNTLRLVEFFQARPYQWIDAKALEQFSRQAWRTRLSDARRAHGMSIVNRLRRDGDVVISEYRYEPAPTLVQHAYEVPMTVEDVLALVCPQEDMPVDHAKVLRENLWDLYD